MDSSILLLVFVSISLSFVEANELARGWGDKIDWLTLEDGLKAAKDENKPLMLVIHKSWCGACKALKPKFAASEDIASLSIHFAMVNLEDDEEPEDDQYKQDGGYIPRIFILNSDGKVIIEHLNEGGNPSYKYYYPSPEDIAKTMTKVVTGGGNEKPITPVREDL